MRFSQRMGLTPVKVELEKEGMSDELRNGLWSVFYENMVIGLENDFRRKGGISMRSMFFKLLWVDFFKRPVDTLVTSSYGVLSDQSPIQYVRDWYFSSKWNEVYDLLEFCLICKDEIQGPINRILKIEMSAYRVVDKILVQVNSEEEAIELEDAIKNLDPSSPARRHLYQAMSLFSDRANPDYRNSIKESISAIESLVKVLLEDEKATLGQALKRLEADHGLHPALKGAFDKLYGYTSDSGGIRHALKDGDVQVNAEEARFMLVTCSAFVNYLITKLN